MATAFMGYVHGANEFLGQTVITNLLKIPLVGESITNWLWEAIQLIIQL